MRVFTATVSGHKILIAYHASNSLQQIERGKNKKLVVSRMRTHFDFCLLFCHLCRPQRHPYFRPHPGHIPHRGPAPRGPQEVTSHSWWAAIRRRHCTAAESLWWCSVTPVLIQHTQDTTYYTPTDDIVS